MKKLFTLMLIGAIFLMTGCKEYPFASIYDAIISPNQIKITIDNNSTTLNNEDDLFEEILKEMGNLIKNSNEMPAFSVSLDYETKECLKSGVWLELIYLDTHTYNEMPFQSLLINVESDWTGFNIIRGNDGLYEGRCYYISLIDRDMSSLYNKLLSCTQN